MEGIDDHISLDVKDSSLLPTAVPKPERQSSLSSHESSNACIYRIPKYFHDKAKDVYTPRVISIGPYHHGKEWLKGMDAFKERYLRDFLTRSRKGKEEFIELIKSREEKLRDSYFEPIAIESNELVEIVLQDGAFLFELLYRIVFVDEYINDRLLRNWFMVDLMKIDILMLENQLPFFILEDLLQFANIQAPRDFQEDSGGFQENEKISMLKLTYIYFKNTPRFSLNPYIMENIYSNGVLHLLDFLRTCHVPLRCTIKKEEVDPCKVLENFPTVTELYQAGVKFRKATSSNFFDIKFNSKTGVLDIPWFTLGSIVNVLLQNMLIFEQFHYYDCLLLTDYVKFLDYLVNIPRDVEILVHNQIILNRLGDNSAAADFLNCVAKDMVFHHNTFYFRDICEKLSLYYRDPRHKFIATLKQNYFNTPWAGISVVAAAVLLVATLLQTVFTIIK